MAHIRDRWHVPGPSGRPIRTSRYGKGRRWQVQYVDDGGTDRGPTFAKRVDAERFKATVEADLLRGTYINPDGGRVLFSAYAEEWVQAQVQHAPGTTEALCSDLRKHMVPFFGDTQIGAIRTSHVKAWVTDRSSVLAPRTMERVYKWFASIMRSAVTDKLIPGTPCVGIKLPAVKATRVVPLPTLAVEAIINAAAPRWRAAFVLAVGTGMREGEVLGTHPDGIDFLRRRIHVESQMRTPNKGRPYLAPPKTDASRRTIPLPDLVLSALSEHIRQYPPTPREVEDLTGPKPKVRPVRLLFPADGGGGIRRNRFIDAVWKPTVRRSVAALRARVDDDEARAAADRLTDGADFHELRHYYASLLIRHGESVKVVQARLGHKSAMETLDTYGHLWPDSEESTRSAVDLALGADQDGSTVQSRSRQVQRG